MAFSDALTGLGVPRMRIGASLMRCSLGLAVLYEWLSLYAYRGFFWQGGFWNENTLGGPLSLLSFSADRLYFEVLYHAALVGAALFAAGVGGRSVTIVFYILVLSMQNANPLILDGGDNILRIVVFYAIFADLTPPRQQNGRQSACLCGFVHNLAILAVVVQLCLVYFSTGAYKIMGEMWQSGTALYYVSRVQWFTWPGVSSVIYESAYVVVVLTYLTVLFEIAFPFLLLNRFTRWSAIAFGVCFHLGIGLLMGLVTFSWIMLSIYFVLLTDREYGTVGKSVSGVVRRGLEGAIRT